MLVILAENKLCTFCIALTVNDFNCCNRNDFFKKSRLTIILKPYKFMKRGTIVKIIELQSTITFVLTV